MARTSNTPKSDDGTHKILEERFNIFTDYTGIQGKNYNIIGSPRIEDKRLKAKIRHPYGYPDDFWEMVANDLSRCFLTLVDKDYDDNILEITVALLEERWLSFARHNEIKTESIVPFKDGDNQPCLDVSYNQVFPLEDEIKPQLANRRLTIIQEFEPEGLIYRIILRAFMY